MRFAPRRGYDVGDLAVGPTGQTSENLPEVSIRVDSSPTATLDNGVKDRAAFSSVGFSDEQPVPFSDGRGANGFHLSPSEKGIVFTGS